MIGWTGEAAAASLTIDLYRAMFSGLNLYNQALCAHQTSCFCPATRCAGLNGSDRIALPNNVLMVLDVYCAGTA